MHFGYNNPCLEYTMGGEKLMLTESEKDLGVVIHSTLKPAAHIANCVKKANQMLGMIQRTITKLKGCNVELQGSSKVGIRDTLVFLICLMCWGGRLFLKGDRRLDSFCFTKLLRVWHKCPSKASLSRRIRVLEENTT